MHLSRLKISGFRSFSPDAPLELSDLGRVNILLGANGSGKTNVGRFVQWLTNGVRKSLNPQGGHPTYERPALLTLSYEESDSWHQSNGPLSAEFGLQASGSPGLERLMLRVSADSKEWLSGGGLLDLRFSASITDGLCRGTLQPYAPNGQPFFENTSGTRSPKFLGPTRRYQSQNDDGQFGPQHFAHGLAELTTTSWFHIPALRHPIAEGALGKKVTTELVTMYSGGSQVSGWTRARERLEGWLRRLLGQSVRVDPIGGAGSNYQAIRITQTMYTPQLGLNLQDLGDGIPQCFYMLAELMLGPNDPVVYFMDEPEAHLHPGALLEFLRIIESDFKHVQLIVSTHSPAVIDGVSSNWKFWRLHRDRRGATQCESVSAQPRRLAALDDLGVVPSHVFMARAVIWVEGPSDIVLYRELLKQERPDLVLGRDYAFALFGGANGKNHVFTLEDAELDGVVDVLTICPVNVFVHDQDSGEASLECGFRSNVNAKIGAS